MRGVPPGALPPCEREQFHSSVRSQGVSSAKGLKPALKVAGPSKEVVPRLASGTLPHQDFVLSARSASTNPPEFVRPVSQPAIVSPKKRSSASGLPGGNATSAARGLRITSPLARQNFGFATASCGFVEGIDGFQEQLDDFENHIRGRGDESSDDGDPDKAPREPDAPVRSAVETQIGELARDLRHLRRQIQSVQTAQRANELREISKSKRHVLRELWRQRHMEKQGKLVLQGKVRCNEETIVGADVHLSNDSCRIFSTPTDKFGRFERSNEAKLGRVMTLSACKAGYAEGIRRVGGEGTKTIRFELLPLSVREKFNAVPGSGEVKSFVDAATGARFDVPIGDLCKDGHPFEGEAEFSASVVDVSTAAGLQAMPPLVGRTVAGSLTQMQSAGCVYVDVRDANNSTKLQLKATTVGIAASISSTATLPVTPVSVWHYDASTGCWEQTMQSVAVNGSELDAPHPDSEVSTFAESGDLVDENDIAQEETTLQDGRQQLDAQRAENGEDKICTCGYEAKLSIIPLVRKFQGLSLADPPKRIFAGVEDCTGVIRPCYPYESPVECDESAERAREEPELVLSHHLARICETLGRPWEGSWRQSSVFFETGARAVIANLRYVGEYLADRAKVTAVSTGEEMLDVDPTFLKLRALELMVGLWVRCDNDPVGWNVSVPTWSELQVSLSEFGGDVGEALLRVSRNLARRQEVAEVRRGLQAVDHRYTVRFSQVNRALDQSKGLVDAAVELLLEDPTVKLSADKLKVRETLFAKMPMAHPKNVEIEKALQLCGGQMEKAATILSKDPLVQESAKEVYKTWKDMLEEAANDPRNEIAFQILDTGWNNVDAPSYFPTPTKFSNYPPLRCSYEFFPPAPRPICPAGDSSMALGAFDEDLPATKATAVDLTWSSAQFTEDVQPDGTFSLCVLGESTFELHSETFCGTNLPTFGPFRAAGRRQATHLGLLSAPREDSETWEDVGGSLNVVLPELSFPPNGKLDKHKWEHWFGRWRWDDENPEQHISGGATIAQSIYGNDWVGNFSLELSSGSNGDRVKFRLGGWTGLGAPEPFQQGEMLKLQIKAPKSQEYPQTVALYMCLEHEMKGECEDALPEPTDEIYTFTGAERLRVIENRDEEATLSATAAKEEDRQGGERCTCFGDVEEKDKEEGYGEECDNEF